MAVTEHMILDLFDQGERFINGISREPKWFSVLIDGELQIPDGITEDEALLVTQPERCLEALAEHANLHAVCNRCGMPPALEDGLTRTGRVIFIESDTSVDEMYRSIGGLFKSVYAWRVKMYDLVLHGKSYTQLLDTSIPILGCPILLSGPGMELKGYTTAKPPQGEIARTLIDKGYFDARAVEYFREYGMPQFWSDITSITLFDSNNKKRPYPLFFYVFRHNENSYLHCAVHLDEVEPTFGLADKLQLLVDAIEMHLRINPPTGTVFKQGVSALLMECAQGSVQPNRHVRSEFEQVGINDKTPWRLHLLDYGFGRDEDLLAARVGLDLLNSAPYMLVALIDACTLVLEREPKGERVFPHAFKQHSMRFPNLAAASDIFCGVEHIPFAYRQVCAIRELSRHRGISKTPGDEISFTQAFFGYSLMGSRRDQQIIDDAVDTCIPARLLREDETTGSNDFDILRVYLSCERRATEAAERLFLHRNTLLYRIRRIERAYGISLDDESTRLRLLAEFTLMGSAEQ